MRAPPSEFVTWSLRWDKTLFFSMLGLMLMLSPALRVYYQVTVVEVAVDRVTPDGHRAALTAPPDLAKPGDGEWRGKILMARLEPRIREYMKGSEWTRDVQPGTRFEWTVRW